MAIGPIKEPFSGESLKFSAAGRKFPAEKTICSAEEQAAADLNKFCTPAALSGESFARRESGGSVTVSLSFHARRVCNKFRNALLLADPEIKPFRAARIFPSLPFPPVSFYLYLPRGILGFAFNSRGAERVLPIIRSTAHHRKRAKNRRNPPAN